MYKVYTHLIIFLSVFILDFHARHSFVVTVYGHTKYRGWTAETPKERYKAYSWWQRILWIPALKENYKSKRTKKIFILMAYFAYIQFVLAIFTDVCFIIADLCFPKSGFWAYSFIAYLLFSLSRFLYSDFILRAGKKKNK